MTASEPQQPSGWNAAPSTQTGPMAGYVYGGFGVRALAFILDAIILGVLSTALAPLFGTGNMVMVEGSRFEINYTANAISTLVGLIYFIGFWVWRQQTPGMIPFTLRVVSAETGEKIDWVRGLLRYVGVLSRVTHIRGGRDCDGDKRRRALCAYAFDSQIDLGRIFRRECFCESGRAREQCQG